MPEMIKAGNKGEQVSTLQTQLAKLGFEVKPDGIFGPATKEALQELQTLFGYDVDGVVGPATQKLIDAQLGYQFNVTSPDAVKKALSGQGKTSDKGALMGAALKRNLQRGFDGVDVRYLQRRLSALGFSVAADGKFGEATEQAVRAVQQAFGYDVDGIVGEATHNLINAQIGYGYTKK